LTVLFFGPPILVALAVLGPWDLGWLPQAEEPYGTRYDPPISLPVVPLQATGGEDTETEWPRGRWSLIYAGLADCDRICIDRLRTLAEVIDALPGEAQYLQRVFLYGGDIGALESSQLAQGLTMGRIDGAAAAGLREALGEGSLAGGSIYIADPRGDLVYSYPPDAEWQGILEDLKRLIAIARIT